MPVSVVTNSPATTRQATYSSPLVVRTSPISEWMFYTDWMQNAGHGIPVTLGTRVEHNPYTGFDFEPSARLAWTATPTSTFWLSAGRAVRQPARADAAMDIDLGTVQLPSGMPAVVYLLGNPHQSAERVTDYEAGYRAQLRPNLSLDAAAFVAQEGLLRRAAGTAVR